MAEEITITAGVPTPVSFAWAGGEGNIEVNGEFQGGIIELQYTHEAAPSDDQWTPFRNELNQPMRFARNDGFGFTLDDAVLIRAKTINGTPDIRVYIKST